MPKHLPSCVPSPQVDNKGNTPLHLASMVGFEGVVEFLIGKGASTSVANADGKTAKEVALDAKTAAVFK